MKRFTPLRAGKAHAVAAGLALGLASQAMPAAEPAPGITDEEIRIGKTCPTSGPLSSFGSVCAMEEAYFKYVNEALGGVKMGDGKTRKIVYRWYNDEYSPPRTVEQVRRLVERDRVAAVIGPLGTATNLAVWDYLNQRGIPHLYVGSGSTLWGADVEAHPWTIAWQLAYSTEASIYAEFVESRMPNAKVAVLYQNDDFGKDLLGAFRRAVEDKDIEVVAARPYEVTSPTVDSQVINLAASDADVFLNFSIPRFAAQAIRKIDELSWDPMQIVVSISASINATIEPAGYDAAQGMYTGAYVMDPGNPEWEDHPDMKFYYKIAREYGGDLVNPDHPITMLGFTSAQQVVETLERTRAPTREAIMQAARHQCDVDIKGVIPGVKVCTDGTADPYPVESLQMMRFEGKQWHTVGEVIDTYEGRTPPPGMEH